jgi:nitrate reductase gamma subunit
MGVFLIVLTYFTFIFLILMVTARLIKIARMPEHLRWELAPIPYEKKKNKYSGSYLEGYEQQQKKRRKSLVVVVIFMAKEMFLFKGVWKNNRPLWPFSFSMHIGIYLVILSILLYIVNALLMITGAPASALDTLESIAAVIALSGFILGGFGAIGLIFKRSLDAGLRYFGSFSIYFRLIFLAAVFISGIYAWFNTGDFTSVMSLFTRSLFTLDSTITAPTSLSVHLIISLLFLIYLPLTDMTHFITKFFTYHAVRWNDEPLNTKMEEKLHSLATQPLSWSASHIQADGRKNWVDITEEEIGEEEKP